MSKLVTGTISIPGLDVVVEACAVLGWPIVEHVEGVALKCRVMDEYARYQPFIRVMIGQDGQAKMNYDHWMGLGTAQGHLDKETDMDECTTRVVGQFRQAIAKVQVERLLKKAKASWRVEQREDGAQVLKVRRAG